MRRTSLVKSRCLFYEVIKVLSVYALLRSGECIYALNLSMKAQYMVIEVIISLSYEWLPVVHEENIFLHKWNKLNF